MQADVAALEPWQEPVRGAAADPSVLLLPGLEQLRIFMSDAAAPPISRLTGLRLTSVGAGSATYAMPASDWLLGPKGFLHAGMLAFLADAPLGSAIITTLPPKTTLTTAELSMTFLGEPPRGGGNLLAQGRLIHADERNALSEVFVTDGEGRLVAHGTSRCFIFPPSDVPYVPRSERDVVVEDTPDPYLRPVPSQTTALPGDMSGLEILQASIRNELPPPPIDVLTGLRPVEAMEGRVVFALPASGWLMNPAGNIYGGMIACLAKSAASGSVQTIAPAGTQFTALDVKVNYLRPGVVGREDLVATGTVVHRGRHLAIASAEIMQGDKRIAVATGSTTLRPPE
ncbi:MAG: PaaI family thioesterase [Actinomycetota bacterium]|nr:PaaI family thioesterase [Actinomycetota bacterium]